jgi:hypothetical protein
MCGRELLVDISNHNQSEDDHNFGYMIHKTGRRSIDSQSPTPVQSTVQNELTKHKQREICVSMRSTVATSALNFAALNHMYGAHDYRSRSAAEASVTRSECTKYLKH